MPLDSITLESLPAVETELNYLVPMAEKPCDYAYVLKISGLDLAASRPI